MTQKNYGDKTSELQFEGVPTVEAELTKLRNALDVAEKALNTIVYYDGYDSCNDPAIWLSEAMNALTAIKQAKE